MNDPIPEPLSGKHVLDWAVPVTRALNAIGDKIGAPARNERDRRPSRQPLPFEVRWDGSLNNSSGGWKIYLPTEHLLTYGGVDVATSDISGATVIQDDDNNDTPWFSLDDVDTSADHVWLVVTVTESNGSVVSVEAEFAAEEGQEETDEKIYNVCVAEVSYTEPEEDGGTAIVEIKQSLVGALHLGVGEAVAPDDVSIERIPEPEEGEEPDGDEGKLQIKGFKTGTPGSTGSLADYLKGEIDLPSEGMQLVARWTDSDGPHVAYIPLAALPEDEGKTITDVEVVPSSAETTVTFTYSDGSITEIHIPHGLKGDPGAPGMDGDTPVITASKIGAITHIYADGDLIATIQDGTTPTITATKANGVTTIYASGIAIAQINDGTDGTAILPDLDVVTGATFAISNGKLVATLSKKNLKTGATSQSSSDVCDVGELDVVVSEDYSTNTHQFTNTRKRIKVIGTPSSATGQTPFTATPLSGE